MSYCASKKSKLLKDFDKTAALLEDYLVGRYGKDLADELHRQTRQEYERIIPQIPHIKGLRAALLLSPAST